MTSHKINFISATKKISTFVLKGASYIAFSKFSKSQDGENFPSPQEVSKIFKNFQQQIFKKIQQQIFKHFQQQIFKNFQH